VSKIVEKYHINGEYYELLIEPHMTLIEVLRDQAELTGTKYGCGAGECGSCTVLIEGEPVLSCSTLAISARDKEIITIEGLTKTGELHPIQKSFVENGAVQCGYCTPGMILTAKALLSSNPSPTREEIMEYLVGNLCRCTGYIKIADAIMAAAKTLKKDSNKSRTI
jgi:carbon-monoxide dehydrogenase small subunit